MSKNITLHVEEGFENLPGDKVTRESKTSGATIVDVCGVASADEKKTGGVVVRFEDVDKVKVESAEIVSVF